MDHTFPHYQTAFSVGPKEGVEFDALLPLLQDAFRRWISKQENARARRFNNKAYGLILDSRFSSGSEVSSWRSAAQTLAGATEHGPAWALLYTWKDDDTEGLSWHCEVTLQAIPSSQRVALAFSLQRSLSPDLFQKENVRTPDPAPPQCIRRLFDSIEGIQLFSGNTTITPPAGRLLRIADTPEAVASLVDDLRSPSRNLPFILLLGAATDPANFAESLAHDLVGKAIVCNVPNRPTLTPLLAPFKIAYGQCRILFPYNRFGPRLRAHPLGSFATTTEAEAFRAFTRPLTLAQFSAAEPLALPDFPSCATLLARASLAQRRSALLHTPPPASDSWEALAKDLYAETSRLRKTLADQAQSLASLNDRLLIAEKLASPLAPKNPT